MHVLVHTRKTGHFLSKMITTAYKLVLMQLESSKVSTIEKGEDKNIYPIMFVADGYDSDLMYHLTH